MRRRINWERLGPWLEEHELRVFLVPFLWLVFSGLGSL